jgi:uncharacterized protein YecE (DUF72 family)
MNKQVFWIGTSGWDYDDWKGIFYPADLPKNRWFKYYARVFPVVEVNATFYSSFEDTTYLKWKERAPQGFRYVLKAPRWITHDKLLLDVQEDIENFCRSAALLGDRLEMILLQLAPHMPYEPERLQKALQAFPDTSLLAVEFRHARWLTPETISMLEASGVTFCNPDSPQHKLTDHLTSSKAYLRLHGRSRWYDHDYSLEELEWIAAQARNLAARGAKQIYIFFNNTTNGRATANALALQTLLNV